MADAHQKYVAEQLKNGVTPEKLIAHLVHHGYESEYARQLVETVNSRMTPVEAEVGESTTPVKPTTQPVSGSEDATALPNPIAIIKMAFRAMVERYDLLLWALGFNVVVFALAQVQTTFEPEMDSSAGIGAAGTLIDVVQIFCYIMLPALLMYCFVHQDAKPGFRDSFSWINRRVFAYLWLGILASLAALGGALLLGIGAIIVGTYVALWFAVFADEDLRGRAALQRSHELVQGHFWLTLVTLFLFGLIFGVIWFVGVLIAVVLIGGGAEMFLAGDTLPLLVTVIVLPIATVAMVAQTALIATLYRLYKAQRPQPALDTHRTLYSILPVLGLLMFGVLIVLQSVLFSLQDAQSDAKNALGELRINNARAQAEIARSMSPDGSYAQTCTALTETIAELQADGVAVQCNDEPDGYALEAQINDGYLCISASTDTVFDPVESDTSSINGTVCNGV